MTKQEEKTETSEEEKTKEHFINTAAFFMFGFTEYITFDALLTAAQDILANTNVPTTTTIMVANGPYLLLSVVCPYFISKIPVVGRIWSAFLCFVLGIIVVAISNELWLRLVGIGINSVGYFFVEVGILPLTAFYSEGTLLAFSGGTGFGLVGTIYYTGLYNAYIKSHLYL